MRLRTIKPGFFKNEDLLALPPLTRLLFAGLWCYCDRDGRCEDRPLRIKVEILPGDNCDVDAMLDELAARGFVVRYEVGGCKYLLLPKFEEHQRPHHKEAASTVPVPVKHAPRKVRAPTLVVPSTNQGACEPALSLGSGVLGVGSGIRSLGDTSSPPAAESPPPAPLREFTDGWCSLFAARRGGTRYAFEGAKDNRHSQAILKLAQGDVAEALRRADVHLVDPFWSERGANLGTFRSQWNRCAQVAGSDARGGPPDPLAGVKDYIARRQFEAAS